MKIVEKFSDGTNVVYDGELREQPLMIEINPTANNGLKLKLRREDEFGHDSFVEISIEAAELQLLKNKQLFSDPLI